MIFFRFSEGSAREFDRRATKPRDARNEVSRLQSRVWLFACLARFARRTKKKERLLVVYFVRPSICPAEPSWVFQPIVFRGRGSCVLIASSLLVIMCSTFCFLYRTPLMAAVGNGFVDCANLLLSEGANMLALDMYHRSALHRAVSSSKNFHHITFLTTFLLNSFV